MYIIENAYVYIIFCLQGIYALHSLHQEILMSSSNRVSTHTRHDCHHLTCLTNLFHFFLSSHIVSVSTLQSARPTVCFFPKAPGCGLPTDDFVFLAVYLSVISRGVHVDLCETFCYTLQLYYPQMFSSHYVHVHACESFWSLTVTTRVQVCRYVYLCKIFCSSQRY